MSVIIVNRDQLDLLYSKAIEETHWTIDSYNRWITWLASKNFTYMVKSYDEVVLTFPDEETKFRFALEYL